jgi:hypothetical protein
MSQQQIVINASPHPGQAQVQRSPARFKVLASGRRWGKTRLGVNLCVDVASRGGRAWWVAPSYKMSEVGWRPLRGIAYRIPGADVRLGDRMVVLPGGGEVVVRSADNPQSLRGESLDFVVLDECAYMHEDAWNEALRPALSDRKGRALFISTPKGLNWFYGLFQRGQNDGQEWQAWRKPTSNNPYIDPAEIEAARKSLPERVFKQEYLAEFLSDGTYFQGIDAAAVIEQPDEPEQHKGHYVVMGVDWAKSKDYTVITTACRDCKRVVDWERFNRIDFTYQRERLYTMAARWNTAGVLPERNSIGEPNIEIIRERVNVLYGADGRMGFDTTGSTKPPLIESLAAALEHDGFKVPRDYADELRAYEVSMTPQGKPKFGAPDGLHDDRVISLALAWRAMTTGRVITLSNPFYN